MANETPISMTERAAARISDVVASEPGAIGLRLSVSGGGCSGFQYLFEIAKERGDDDIEVNINNALLLVDEMSVPFVSGAVLDYVDDLIGAKFEVKNPNAKAACGCGTSFSV